MTIINEKCVGDFSQAINSRNEYGLVHSEDFEKINNVHGKQINYSLSYDQMFFQ